ncbi:MAG: metallophosphoesterase [Enterocloster sp.]
MRRNKWIAGIAALGLCMAASGCSLQTGGRGDKSTESTAYTTEAQKVTEPETQKPSHAQPSEIEPFPNDEKETKAEPLKGGKRIVLMTDIHYLARSLTDNGEAFRSMVEHGDGKLTNYVWEITDAAFGEIEMLNPDVLILAGDLSLDGEKKSHEELAKKLDEVEKNGITVVVIPGNHDINNPHASAFSERDRYPAEPTSPSDFERIYGEFGYKEAGSRDPNSLSYTYDLDPSMRLLMLDTCQYTPRNKVGGMIKTETYEWIGKQLDKAREDGVILLPVGHHNLLDESKVYVDDCTIEHSDELIDMLESENIPLFLSGHLHVQHFMQHNDMGIYEIVTSSLSTPPCQYGVLEYMENDTFSYSTRQVDMEKWARKNHSTDENLLNFNTYSPYTLKQIFYNQAYDAMKNSAEEETGSVYVKLTEDQKQQMSGVYADINTACYAGRAWDVAEDAVKEPGYKMWQEYCYPSILYEYLEYIVEDAVKDYNHLTVD